MQRREFITLLGGAAATWPLTARGQQIKMARIGALYIGLADEASADLSENYRLAAGYIDQILRGTKVADLPFQEPTRLALSINLGTARTLRIAVPPSLLARADEVID